MTSPGAELASCSGQVSALQSWPWDSMWALVSVCWGAAGPLLWSCLGTALCWWRQGRGWEAGWALQVGHAPFISLTQVAEVEGHVPVDLQDRGIR